MARSTDGICPMSLHLLALGDRLPYSLLVQSGHIRRWRRDWGVEDVLQYPLAPQYDGGSGGVRGDSQDTGLRQHSASRRPRQIHFSKFGTSDALYTVMSCQALI